MMANAPANVRKPLTHQVKAMTAGAAPPAAVIEAMENQGFDVISVRPNPKIMKLLIKHDFFKWLNPVKATEFALWSSTYIVCDSFNIPLIIQGENPGLTLGASLTGVGTDSNCLNAEKLETLSTGWKDYLEIDGVEEKDLFLLQYLK